MFFWSVQKLVFLQFCWEFPEHPSRFLSIFERFWVPVGLIVRCFFCIWFWSHFSCMFFPQMQKLEKWKSSSWPVKYNVSWVAKLKKKHANVKKQLSFPMIFDKKINQKSNKNSRKTALCTKIDRTALLGSLFSPLGRLSVDFGLLRGSSVSSFLAHFWKK